MTPAEKKLWGWLGASRLGGWQFRRQQNVDGFIVDFYCHQADLVVEVDGPTHRGQQEADQRREDVLKSKGLRVTRFMNEEVEPNLEGVCGGILDHLGEIS